MTELATTVKQTTKHLCVWRAIVKEVFVIDLHGTGIFYQNIVGRASDQSL